MNTFLALADDNRRKIVEILASKGELSVSEINKEFNISAPAVSQHLKVLKESQILTVKKDAQKRLYSINTDKIIEIDDWFLSIKKNWEERLDRLDSYLLKNFKNGE